MVSQNKLAAITILVGVLIAVAILSGVYFAEFLTEPQTENTREIHPDRQKFIGAWEHKPLRCKFNEDGTGYIDGPLLAPGTTDSTPRIYLKNWKIEKSESGYYNVLVITPKYYSESGIVDSQLEYQFRKYQGYTLLDLTFEQGFAAGTTTLTYHKVE